MDVAMEHQIQNMEKQKLLEWKVRDETEMEVETG
jgi:hypothetical protein